MAHTDTVEKILDSAAALFAERGFAETSLRTITSSANVNLAAVNYHFGSKKSLIQAVFSRYLTPFTEQLNIQLDQLILECGDHPPTVDRLMRVLFSSLLASTGNEKINANQFMRLLGLAYSQTQEHLRHFILSQFGTHYRRFIELLSQAIPSLKPEVFYWRLYFMLGSSIFTLSSFDSINSILKADYHKDTSLEEVVNLLVESNCAILVGNP